MFDVSATQKTGTKELVDRLERKVVLNAAMIISKGDKPRTCARKVADSLADAVGLHVDFSIFSS